MFGSVVVNADDVIFESIAREYGAEFYLRPHSLGSSDTRSDEVVYDFIETHPEADIVTCVNSTTPLQTIEEVRQVVKHFQDKKLDSLITVRDIQSQVVLNNEPVNFNPKELFSKSQDLTPVQFCVYSIMMWRSTCFKKNYERDGYAMLSGRLGYFPVSKETSVFIKYKEDLDLAERILESRKKSGKEVQYFEPYA